MTTFSELGLAEPICRAVAAEGYTEPTAIQSKAIPLVLSGRDVMGLAQTGTGKTAAFALPILHRLSQDHGRLVPKTVRALVLTPTRELACQVSDCFATYGRHTSLRRTSVFGGVGMNPQIRALSYGNDVVIATPGRLLDMVNRGYVRLDAVEILVLDEADRMLDMGFLPDVRKLVAQTPFRRQTLFFSATMAPPVAELAKTILREAERVEVAPTSSTVERIEQKVMFVTRDDKRPLLIEILKDASVSRAIVFARTKHGANRLAEQLQKAGHPTEAIHGNKSQGARQRALSDFQAGRVKTLVATDIAARGIDVDGISHVINYELPNEPESYVHRIGRTARAGRTGVAVSFCELEELAYLKAIEKTIRQPVPVDIEHAYHSVEIAARRTGPGPLPKPPAMGGRGRQNSGTPQGASGKPQGGKPHNSSARPAGGHGQPRPQQRRRPGGERSAA